MKKILLMVLLGITVGVKGEEIRREVNLKDLEVQSITFGDKILIKDHGILREGYFEENKFEEIGNEKIILDSVKETCTKKICIKVDDNNLPIIKSENGKIEKANWSFGPSKRIIENSLIRK